MAAGARHPGVPRGAHRAPAGAHPAASVPLRFQLWLECGRIGQLGGAVVVAARRARARTRTRPRPSGHGVHRAVGVVGGALARQLPPSRRRVDGSSARPLHAHLLAVGERERRFRQRCVEAFAAAPDTERLHAECFYGTDAATRAAQRLIELWRCARAARPRGWSHGARTTAWRALITALRDTWPQQPLWCTRCRAVCGVSLLVCLECVRWHNGTLTGVLCPADLDTAQDVADKRVHLRNAHSGSAQQAPHSPLPVLVVSIVPHETELHTLADTLLH
eukprot:ctg_468.g243